MSEDGRNEAIEVKSKNQHFTNRVSQRNFREESLSMLSRPFRGVSPKFYHRNEEKIFEKIILVEENLFLIDRDEIGNFLVNAKRTFDDFKSIEDSFCSHFQVDHLEKSLFDSFKNEENPEINIFYGSLLIKDFPWSNSNVEQFRESLRNMDALSSGDDLVSLLCQSNVIVDGQISLVGSI